MSSTKLPGPPVVLRTRVAAPSVCCALACILLAAAPTATPCFRHWRRSSLLPLVGEEAKLHEMPKPLPLGEVSPKVTERASPLPNSYCTAMSRAFDRAVLSLCLGVSVSSLALSGACAPRPGCGTQRLLRCRLHPAGRCPNSSSLFPPLAAVVAVAPKGRATGVSVRPALGEKSSSCRER